MRSRSLGLRVLALAAVLAAAPAAAAGAQETRVDPGSPDSPVVDHAVAVLHPTQGHETRGVVRFAKDPTGGLAVSADFEGLSPGAHGMHVHLLGDCTADDGTSAGTHFNFRGSSKNPPADIDRITGDLGDVQAGADGSGHLEATVPHATLTGPYSILGRAVIIHEKPNDPTQPPIGAAGGRLACGVIGIDEGGGS